MKTKEETVQLMNQGVKSNYHVINIENVTHMKIRYDIINPLSPEVLLSAYRHYDPAHFSVR